MNNELKKIIKLLEAENISKYNMYDLQGINFKINDYNSYYSDFNVEGVLICVDRYIPNLSVYYDKLHQIKNRLKRYKNIVVYNNSMNSIIIFEKSDFIAWQKVVAEDKMKTDNFNLWRHDLIEKYGSKNVAC